MQPRKRLGQLLTELGVVDELQIQSALGHQKQWGGKLGTILVQKGFCREEDVVRVLAQHLALPVVRLADVKVDPRAVKLVSRQVAEKLHVFAFEVSGAGRSEVVTVAMSDPTDLSSVDQLAFHTGKRIKPVLCGDSEIVLAFQQNYGGEPTPAGQQAPGQPAQQTGRTGPGGRPLPPLGPPPVMQPLRPPVGQPATPPARGQPATAPAPGQPALQQATVPGAFAPASAAVRPVPPVAAPRASAPAGVGAAAQPVAPPPAAAGAPSAPPGIEGLESIAASAAGESAVEGTEAFNDQGQTADAVEGIEPISDSTIDEGRAVAETDITVDGDFGEAPGDGPMEGLEPIAAHAQDAMEAGAGPGAAAEAPPESDWDAPAVAQPASPHTAPADQGATADVSWDEGPAAAEAIPGGHHDPGGWDAPAEAASEPRHDAPALAAAQDWSADGSEAELPADELPADAILGTAEDVLEPAPHQEPEPAAPTGLPAWEDAPAPERSPWDDAPVQELAAPQPTQSPWADEPAQEVAAEAAPSPWGAQPEEAAPEAAPSQWGEESGQAEAAPEAAPSPWGAEPAQEAAAPEEAPSAWGDASAQEGAPPESAPDVAPALDAEPGPGAFPDWAAETPSHFDPVATPDAAPAADAAAPDAAAESPPDESESHAKTGKLFGFLAGSFNMAPPVEEVELPPEPGAAAVAGADQTQAGAENEPQGEAEAPDAWSDVADPLAAEAPAGLEAGTDAPASELASADAPPEPEGRASIPVDWAEDVPVDASPADEQSDPATEPAAEEFDHAGAQPTDAFAHPSEYADGEQSAAAQDAEEHQAQPAFGEWSEGAPSFDEAPPTDRIPFGSLAAEPPAEDAFAAEGSQASAESASDEISLDDSAAGPAAAEPGVEFSAGEEGAAGDLPESPTEEFAAAGPASWEPAAVESAREETGGEAALAAPGLEEYAVPGWVPPPPEPQPEGSGWLGQALASTPEPLSEAEEELLRAAGVEPSDGMGAMRLLAGLLRALQRRGVLEVSEVAADVSAARSAGLDPPAPDESGAEPDAEHPV
jgi:hypothetical protein